MTDQECLEAGNCPATGAPCLTMVPLRDFVMSEIKALRREVQTFHNEQESRVALASVSLSSRLDSMNEFRGQMKDQAATLATRTEVMSAIASLRAEVSSMRERFLADIQELREFRAVVNSKASSASVRITQGIALASLLVGLGGLVFAVSAFIIAK